MVELFLAPLFRCYPLPWHPLRCLAQSRRKPERALARHLPHCQQTTRRWYGTSRTSAASTAGGKHIDFIRCSCSRLVQSPAPTSLDRCLACCVSDQHVFLYIRPPQRHSHPCFCEDPTGSFVACYEVSRRYDGSLRLERRSYHPKHGSLRFKRRSVSNGSPRFGRRSPPLRLSSGDRSLRLWCSSSQPRRGARAPSTAPPSHAPRCNQTAAPARRSFE